MQESRKENIKSLVMEEFRDFNLEHIPFEKQDLFKEIFNSIHVKDIRINFNSFGPIENLTGKHYVELDIEFNFSSSLIETKLGVLNNSVLFGSQFNDSYEDMISEYLVNSYDDNYFADEPMNVVDFAEFYEVNVSLLNQVFLSNNFHNYLESFREELLEIFKESTINAYQKYYPDALILLTLSPDNNFINIDIKAPNHEFSFKKII